MSDNDINTTSIIVNIRLSKAPARTTMFQKKKKYIIKTLDQLSIVKFWNEKQNELNNYLVLANINVTISTVIK